MIRGIRGATTVANDSEQEVILSTESLLLEMINQNHVNPDQTASVFISVTPDLVSAFPAKALRKIHGWDYVPVMCMQEIPVEGSLPRCIRVMLHVNTEVKQSDIIHIYQRDAVTLRPDLVNNSKL
ncbi:chorismate mutase [Jeotgalibacillus sp. R-1-5s-1]|uniref:chorismate mutase n=1 Tax=Jeotgalibacillus sp. R-1-5s-1 TaxID=2555897 RepID=UPI00106B70F7|nr:chorismate mutase [Jeotgalibacillus sp. R-1-5s-1]TFE03214.1 chorismate mutase [Jeotgalibacillus sp. R-1-5s-1]